MRFSLFIPFQLLFHFHLYVCPQGQNLPPILLSFLFFFFWVESGDKFLGIRIQFVYQQEIEWVSLNESSAKVPESVRSPSISTQPKTNPQKIHPPSGDGVFVISCINFPLDSQFPSFLLAFFIFFRLFSTFLPP